MRFAVLDFESYFDDEYSLSRMSTEAYVRDSRFEAHGAAIKWSPDHDAKWYDSRQLKQVLKDEDWSDVCLIAHHQQFDGFILSQHYGVVPELYACTLSMARLCLGNHLSVSLDSVRKHFNLPEKKTPYNLFKGRHWHEMTADVQEQVAEGACDEVESIWKIFCELGKVFPREEYAVVDATIRMFTQPVLEADAILLAQLWEKEHAAKLQRAGSLGVTAAQLQSADGFLSLLEAEGIEIEYKEGRNGEIPCFAKTDDFMRDLLEHPNDRIRGLAEARIGAKSTLLQTRAETLGWMAARGPLPVYLRYAGAHTTRWSGGDGVNWQNFKRGSDLRKAIMAPEGWLLGVIDLSQIECRILNWLAGQNDVVEKFRRGEDPYVGIASRFYGRAITKNDTNERGTGKQAELSCGYGCGAARFQATAKLGIYGPPVEITPEEAGRFVNLYRSTHVQVVNYWKVASRMIARLAGGPPCQWGPMMVRDGKIFLPNKAWIDYPELAFYKDNERDESYWRAKKRNGWMKLYGAKIVEQTTQALARVVLSQACIRIKNRLGLHPVMLAHDEGVWLVKNDQTKEKTFEILCEEMRRTPPWLENLPLSCEGLLSERYSK